MTHPTQADALAAITRLQNNWSKIIQIGMLPDDCETLRTYIHGQKPVDVDFDKAFGQFADWESEAYSRGVSIDDGDVEKLRLFYDFLAAQGLLHSAEHIGIDRKDVPEGLEEAIAAYDRPDISGGVSSKELSCLVNAAALVAKKMGD